MVMTNMFTLSNAIRVLGLENSDCIKTKEGAIFTISELKKTKDLTKIEVVKIKPWISISDREFLGYIITWKEHK